MCIRDRDEIETFVHSHAGTEIAQDVLGVAGIAAEAGTALGQPEVTAVAKDVEDVVTDVERDVPEPPPDNNG